MRLYAFSDLRSNLGMTGMYDALNVDRYVQHGTAVRSKYAVTFNSFAPTLDHTFYKAAASIES